MRWWILVVQLWAAVSRFCGLRCIIVLTLLLFQIHLEGEAMEDGHQNTGRVSPFSDPGSCTWSFWPLLIPNKSPWLFPFSEASSHQFNSSLKKRSVIITILHLFKCWEVTCFTAHNCPPSITGTALIKPTGSHPTSALFQQVLTPVSLLCYRTLTWVRQLCRCTTHVSGEESWQ